MSNAYSSADTAFVCHIAFFTLRMYSRIRQIAKNWIKRGKRETKKYIYKTIKENWEKGIGGPK